MLRKLGHSGQSLVRLPFARRRTADVGSSSTWREQLGPRSIATGGSGQIVTDGRPCKYSAYQFEPAELV